MSSITPDQENNSILTAALELADEGKPVFPVSKRKTPAISKASVDKMFGDGKYGLHMASTDPDKIEEMFSQRGVTGIGMPTGKVSGCTVVDVDCGSGKKSRQEALSWLEVNRREALWGASVVRTMSGGLHYYCKYNKDIPSSGNVWAMGVDCRNDGGYVVVPPFMGYKWERQVDPDDWPSPPTKFREKLSIERDQATGGETPEHVARLIEMMNAAKGDDDGWHTAALGLTAHLVGAGWSDAEILRTAVQWTKGGYTHRETFEDLCIMLAGARAKWDRQKQPKTTEQARMERIVGLWNQLQPASKRNFMEALKGE